MTGGVSTVGGANNSATSYPLVSQWLRYTITLILIPLHKAGHSFISSSCRLFNNAFRNANHFVFVKHRQHTIDYIVGIGIGAIFHAVFIYMHETRNREVHNRYPAGSRIVFPPQTPTSRDDDAPQPQDSSKIVVDVTRSRMNTERANDNSSSRSSSQSEASSSSSLPSSSSSAASGSNTSSTSSASLDSNSNVI